MDKVALRRATLSDTTFLWIVRNQRDVVAASRVAQPVSLSEHRAWIARTLTDPTRALYVILAPDPVGSGRLDFHGDTAEISVALVPAARGAQIGTAAIRLLVAEAGGRRVCAEIGRANAASMIAFIRAGFRPGEAGHTPAFLWWTHA